LVVRVYISQEIQRLRTKILLASENGLFTRICNTGESKCMDKIWKLLKEAQENVGSNPIEAQYKLDVARCQFDKAVEKAGLQWRIKYVYAIPVFLYLVVAFIVFLLMWYYIALYHQGNIIVFWIPAWSIIWGGVGSILRGIYWLWYQVNRRHYKKYWLLWFLGAPIMGCILGGMMYLIFVSGYVAATQSSLTDEKLLMLLCGLAGFSWPWATNVMKKLTEIFGAKTTT